MPLCHHAGSAVLDGSIGEADSFKPFWGQVTRVVNWDTQKQQSPKDLGTGTFEINIP